MLALLTPYKGICIGKYSVLSRNEGY